MTPVAEPDGRFCELTIVAFHDALRSGEITSAELVDWYLARIEAHNLAGAELHAVVTINPAARDEAVACDEFLAGEGKLCGPLHGVPVLVKDQAETAGLRTTFGSIVFTGYVPDEDATVVAKLKDAGAVILAKTAMCDFAAGWFSSSSLTDHTKNPYARSANPAAQVPGRRRAWLPISGWSGSVRTPEDQSGFRPRTTTCLDSVSPPG